MEKIRIMLAEDHALLRSSLQDSLEHFSDFEVVGEASDGEEALELVKSLQPDILICDIRMPGISGIEVARQVKELSPETKILVLSAYDDEDYVVELFKVGIAGYLMKTVDLKQLIETVRIIQLGQTVFHPTIAAKLASVVPQRESSSGKLDCLSHRELEILQLAAKGLTNREVAVKLDLSTRTVEGHVANIVAKLGASSRTRAVEYFRKA
jgi:NarL family two-component system response regulator LiaR